MDLKEIGKLTDKELNAVAAKLDGWANSVISCDNYWYHTQGGRGIVCYPPNYINDIAAAWELW